MSPELAALAVHDLKNALGGLEAQLVELEHSPRVEIARRARLQCGQLRRELVAFLTLYRGSSLRAAVEDESPSSLLAALAASARHDGAGREIKVGCGAAAPPFWFYDVRLVRLALDAALHNACRFARRQVVLDAAAQDGWLVLSVEDDGPGLAGAAAARDAWATGLGTELCQAVARAHDNGERHGSVHLFDRAEGGARFELRLP